MTSFFFSSLGRQPTNRGPVRHSDPGTPLAVSRSTLQWHCIFMVNEQIVGVIFVYSTLQLLTALLTPKSMLGKAKSAEKKAQICRETSVSRPESGRKGCLAIFIPMGLKMSTFSLIFVEECITNHISFLYNQNSIAIKFESQIYKFYVIASRNGG